MAEVVVASVIECSLYLCFPFFFFLPAIGVLCQLAAKTHHNVVERGTKIAFGGDLLFLLRNLAVSIHDRTAQKKCQRYLSRVSASVMQC